MTCRRTSPFLIRTALGMLSNTDGEAGGGATTAPDDAPED